jgi:hypothetical protein
MMFTCRFVVSLLSLSVSATTADTVRGNPRALGADDMDVDLGAAGEYAIFAASGISTVPQSAIYGNIGVWPIAATAITGFGNAMDVSNAYSTASQVVDGGKIFAASYVGSLDSIATPTRMKNAWDDMMIAYTNAKGKTAATSVSKLNPGGGKLGGVNPGGKADPLLPGVYTFGTAVSITGDLYFSAPGTSRHDTYIIQTAGAVTQAAGVTMYLNGVESSNIIWAVATSYTIGANAHVEGIILAKAAVNFGNLASLNGRVLTQTACTLNMATIRQPCDEST